MLNCFFLSEHACSKCLCFYLFIPIHKNSNFLTPAVMHDLQLNHTDLKPENILLVSPETTRVHDYKALNFQIRTWPKFEISRMYIFVFLSFFGGDPLVAQCSLLHE